MAQTRFPMCLTSWFSPRSLWRSWILDWTRTHSLWWLYRREKCFLYKEHQWVPWTNMGTARAGASALQRHVWHDALIIGGADERGKSLKTTELISSNGSVKTNNFPETIHSHCSFPFNSTHSLVTGGLVELVCQHLVCGLDQYQYHTRTNHENSKRRTWLFHYSNRN